MRWVGDVGWRMGGGGGSALVFVFFLFGGLVRKESKNMISS